MQKAFKNEGKSMKRMNQRKYYNPTFFDACNESTHT